MYFCLKIIKRNKKFLLLLKSDQIMIESEKTIDVSYSCLPLFYPFLTFPPFPPTNTIYLHQKLMQVDATYLGL